MQAAALRLLDQPPRRRGDLRPGPAVARASAPDPGLRARGLGRLRAHPEWAADVLDHVRRELGAAHLPGDRLDGLAELVLAFEDRPAVGDLLAVAAADPAATAGRRAWALATMARSRLAEPPGRGPTPSPGASTTPGRRSGTGRPGGGRPAGPPVGPGPVGPRRRPGKPADLRLEALRAALPRHPSPSPAVFELLLGRLGAAAGPADRLAAAGLLGRARLDEPAASDSWGPSVATP